MYQASQLFLTETSEPQHIPTSFPLSVPTAYHISQLQGVFQSLCNRNVLQQVAEQDIRT